MFRTSGTTTRWATGELKGREGEGGGKGGRVKLWFVM